MFKEKENEDNLIEKEKKVLVAVENLSQALNKYHGNSETAKYVSDTLAELEKDEGEAFIGTFQYFITKASILKRSEGVELNETEYLLWHKMTSYRELGYGLFFGMGLHL